jgi:hypothetical protein
MTLGKIVAAFIFTLVVTIAALSVVQFAPQRTTTQRQLE